MKKKLIVYEINECDFNFFKNGSKKFKFPEINNFFSRFKQINTFTNDKQEGVNLDPWVQWVSVHTGLSSNKHKVFRIGQKLDNKIKQIWDILSKKGITCTIWGAFNSNLRNKKNINLFFPDPWSFTQKAYPNYFNKFLKLPMYYAESYPSSSKLLLLKHSLNFIKGIFFSNIIFYFIKNFHYFTFFLIRGGFKSFNLYFFLDLVSLLIVQKDLKLKKSNLAIIAINCFAHYQHNFWNDGKYDFIYFWYLNEMVKVFKSLDFNYNSSIIYNGFSQKKIKNEFHLRPKNAENFLKLFNTPFYLVKPNMTSGMTIFFSSYKDKVKMIKALKKINVFSYPLFEIDNFKNKNTIFVKCALIMKKKINSFDLINKKNLKSYFYKPKKSRYNIKPTGSNDLNSIFQNLLFLKSTSRHISDGIMLHKNFNEINKLKKETILNQEIFSLIVKYFN